MQNHYKRPIRILGNARLPVVLLLWFMHITTEMFGYTVHADTLYFAWACMALIILASAIFASGLNSDPNKYGLRQHMAEAIFNNWLEIISNKEIETISNQNTKEH